MGRGDGLMKVFTCVVDGFGSDLASAKAGAICKIYDYKMDN